MLLDIETNRCLKLNAIVMYGESSENEEFGYKITLIIVMYLSILGYLLLYHNLY